MLAPVLLAQGAWVRLRTPRLPEPPGARTGTAGTGPPLRLLVLGDSAAAGVGAPHQEVALLGQVVSRLAEERRVTWRLAARTGATTASTLEEIAGLADERFDVVVTSIGVNDVTSFLRLETWLGLQARLRARLRGSLGASRILVTGVPPMGRFPALPRPLCWYLGRRARRFDRRLEAALSDEPDVAFVRLELDGDAGLMAEDGFHPGPEIYARWGRRVAELVRDGPDGVGDGRAAGG